MNRLLTIVTLLAVACGGGGSPPAEQSADFPAPTDPTPPAAPAVPTEPSAPTEPAPPSGDPAAPGGRQHADHSHCGWIGADTADQGVASFMAHPDWFDAIHPKWFTLKDDGTPRSIAFTDDARVTETARAHGVKLIPLIDADSADQVRRAASNPAAHAQLLADLVVQHGYDGLELDYEHLWSKGDRAPFTALVTAIASALHAKGKVVTMAVPSLWRDNGDNGYDYVALQQVVDTLHLMGYDYHWLSGPHMGPIAPKGWIEEVLKHVESLGAPQKYVLGVANYAIGSGWYATTAEAVSLCGSAYSSETNHMASCSLGEHEAAGLAPHCNSSKGEVWFEDAGSVGEKAAMARAHKLGGMTYWTLGSEPPRFFEAISAQYP